MPGRTKIVFFNIRVGSEATILSGAICQPGSCVSLRICLSQKWSYVIWIGVDKDGNWSSFETESPQEYQIPETISAYLPFCTSTPTQFRVHCVREGNMGGQRRLKGHIRLWIFDDWFTKTLPFEVHCYTRCFFRISYYWLFLQYYTQC